MLLATLAAIILGNALRGVIRASECVIRAGHIFYAT